MDKKMYFAIAADGNICTPFQAQPDSSICVEDLISHFRLHADRWNTAFQFLSRIADTVKDMPQGGTLPLGRINLTDDVYANIDTYAPKPIEQCRGESHQHYIDIQYVVRGQEYIGLTRDTALPIMTPYDSEKDITFYHWQPQKLLLADPTKFFIFFPADIHAPGIRTEQTTDVMKIVVKVRL